MPTCYRYIELNPIQAWMTDEPKGYSWSSCHCNAAGHPDPWITPHPTYLALGRCESDRHVAYCALLDEFLPDDTLAEIRIYLQQRVLGTDRFLEQVQAKLQRFAGVRPAIDPAKPRPKVTLTPFFP